MKTVELPTREQLISAYEILQFSHDQLTLDQIVLWSRWSRLDARLGELMALTLASRLESIDAIQLWQKNLQVDQPQSLAVITEFSRLSIELANRDESRNKLRLFNSWCAALVHKIAKADPQMYFVIEGLPKPKKMCDDVQASLRYFSRWGYFSTEPLVRLKSESALLKRKTRWNTTLRRRALAELMARKSEFTVDDYISECEGQIHRRTAERDLKNSRDLRPVGQTRARAYKRRFR